MFWSAKRRAFDGAPMPCDGIGSSVRSSCVPEASPFGRVGAKS